METAQSKGYTHLWLETDSQLVCLALKSSANVPWVLRNRWPNCLFFVKNIKFIFSHVYRKGNTYADGLANLGLNSLFNDFVWFDTIPDLIRGSTLGIVWDYLILGLLISKRFWPSPPFSFLYYLYFLVNIF